MAAFYSTALGVKQGEGGGDKDINININRMDSFLIMISQSMKYL